MKTTILDTCPRISIYQLIRLGAFKKNSTFHFQDSINALSYTITADVSGSSPIINIDLKSSAGVVHQSVRVQVAPSHLGNHQVLRLICPFTGTKCCILHLYKYYFMHRSAFKSTYASRTICPSRRHIAHTIRTIYTGQKYLWLATRPYLRISYRGQPTRTFLRLQRFALRHANRLFTFPTPKTKTTPKPKTLSTMSTVLRSRTLPSAPRSLSPLSIPHCFPALALNPALFPRTRTQAKRTFPTISTVLRSRTLPSALRSLSPHSIPHCFPALKRSAHSPRFRPFQPLPLSALFLRTQAQRRSALKRSAHSPRFRPFSNQRTIPPNLPFLERGPGLPTAGRVRPLHSPRFRLFFHNPTNPTNPMHPSLPTIKAVFNFRKSGLLARSRSLAASKTAASRALCESAIFRSRLFFCFFSFGERKRKEGSRVVHTLLFPAPALFPRTPHSSEALPRSQAQLFFPLKFVRLHHACHTRTGH